MKRIAFFFCCMIFSLIFPLRGEDGIYFYSDSSGRMIFTNAPTSPQCKCIYGKPKKKTPAGQSRAVRARYEELIVTTALEHGLDPELIKAVIEVESNFNSTAISPKGAVGLMQLLPITAQRFGVRDSFDPAENIRGGTRYLQYLFRLFRGNLELSLAAYNAGENIVKSLGCIPPYRETINYVRKVKNLYNGSGRV
jgi:soluble lytic murein transglycosylase-like protein